MKLITRINFNFLRKFFSLKELLHLLEIFPFSEKSFFLSEVIPTLESLA